jgi:leucyl-tRNA synthetase
MKPKRASHYPFWEIEPKWQKIWEEKKLYSQDLSDSTDKLYCLVMFIYPSADKLHIGQWYNYGPTDTWARYKRLCGYRVFEPMGYDAFGLPAENYAIQKGIHPAKSTADNIAYIRNQLKAIGAMYDWSKEVDTSRPDYYKWTQWIFLKLYERGLAYRKKAPVNWCPSCRTVLANEQVVEGQCERCESPVTKKDLVQWFFKITDYADRLLENHAKLDWPKKTVSMQKNWIGRSEGTEIVFEVAGTGDKLPVFTTRADTVFGVTYMVLAPEHPLVEKITTPENRGEVEKYIEQARRLSEIDRTSTVKEKTGVFTGAYAVNPVNGEKVPIWIADYVLLTYGTGAVMAVPGHDQRDFEFAREFDLPIREVITPKKGKPQGELETAYVDYGYMYNSGEFDGLPSKEGIEKVSGFLESKGCGKKTVSYKLRDWLISRQRYWGAPIPIIHCPKCGEVPVPEKELPVRLPQLVDFKPSGTGESPLATSPEFVSTKCPKCGGEARRDTETMDTFVDSSWYFLRFLDPDYEEGPFNPELSKKWLPVDHYVGGAEHAVMHLMYARFINMFLYDQGYIHFEEPFLRLRHQGIITNKGAKMSKSKGNVIIPDDLITTYGSDTFRMYLMFMGSYEDGGDWDDSGISGVARFLGRVYRLYAQYDSKLQDIAKVTLKPETFSDGETALYLKLNQTIKKVGADIDTQAYNTAIAALMELFNEVTHFRETDKETPVLLFALERALILLAPLAPHLSEELWERTGHKDSIFNARWPQYDPAWIQAEEIEMVVQVNGKLRASLSVPVDISEADFKEKALAHEKIKAYTQGKHIRKAIFVKNKLLNVVVK